MTRLHFAPRNVFSGAMSIGRPYSGYSLNPIMIDAEKSTRMPLLVLDRFHAIDLDPPIKVTAIRKVCAVRQVVLKPWRYTVEVTQEFLGHINETTN